MRERRFAISPDEKRKLLVTFTFVVVILFLGLGSVSEENNHHFFRIKSDTLNLYSFPIGITQSSYAANFSGPITQSRWGVSDLIPIAQYKYYFVAAALLLGIASVAAVKDR